VTKTFVKTEANRDLERCGYSMDWLLRHGVKPFVTKSGDIFLQDPPMFVEGIAYTRKQPRQGIWGALKQKAKKEPVSLQMAHNSLPVYGPELEVSSRDDEETAKNKNRVRRNRLRRRRQRVSIVMKRYGKQKAQKGREKA